MRNERLPIDKLEPGMTTAEAVHDQKGRVIIPAGARLTPMHIKGLHKWGVDSVAIQSAEESGGGETTEPSGKNVLATGSAEEQEFMRRVALEVTQKFANLEDSKFNQSFKKLAVKHLVLGGRGAVPGLK